MDEIIIDAKLKDKLEQEGVDEISIERLTKPGLSEEAVDEISVTEDNKKLVKSTWDSLDVQGSGFELLGKPIVSRLENQDVSAQVKQKTKKLDIEYLDELTIKKSEEAINIRNIEKNIKKCKIVKSDKFIIKRSLAYVKNKETQLKDEYIQSSVETTEKSKRDNLNQKYKSISQNVTANINLQKRDDYIKKSKDKGQKYTQVNKYYKKDDESEITSDSHISIKVIKDIKKKEEKPKIIPRTRKERKEKKEESDNISESISHISHHSIKVTQNIQQKKERNVTQPRKRREDSSGISSGNLSNMSRKVIVDTKEDKTKGQKRQTTLDTKYITKKYKKSEDESEKGSESSSHITKKIITYTNKTPKETKIKEQKYFIKKIDITPSKEEIRKNKYDYSIKNKGNKDNKGNKEQKYFSKNIVIQPVIAGTQQRTISQSKISTSGNRTNIHQYQNQNIKRRTRGVSSDDKKIVKTIDILKGVKYFTKNIVIEPVQEGKYNIQKESGRDSENKWSKQSGSSAFSRVRRGNERRPWEIDSKNGEDMFYGRISNDMEVINEKVLKSIPGIDENTKFFHKEITITPVIIPPPMFSQH